LYFEERKVVPKEVANPNLIARGFHKKVAIEDFPLRTNTVYLHARQRRWVAKETRQIIQRDWSLVAQ